MLYGLCGSEGIIASISVFSLSGSSFVSTRGGFSLLLEGKKDKSSLALSRASSSSSATI